MLEVEVTNFQYDFQRLLFVQLQNNAVTPSLRLVKPESIRLSFIQLPISFIRPEIVPILTSCAV